MEASKERLEHLANMMKNHDWNYRFSDSSSHWQRSDIMGQQICRESEELRRAGFETEVDALWKIWSPR